MLKLQMLNLVKIGKLIRKINQKWLILSEMQFCAVGDIDDDDGGDDDGDDDDNDNHDCKI